MITQELLKQMFTYHQDGTLFYNKNGKKVIANPSKYNNYTYVNIDRKPVKFHRIVYLYCHGYLPDCIDHINGIRHDNRIENLRPSTKQENCLNRTKSKNNTSGFKNVSWSKVGKKWTVQLKANNKYTNFGYYEDIELADLVAQEARNLYHGAFARHS